MSKSKEKRLIPFWFGPLCGETTPATEELEQFLAIKLKHLHLYELISDAVYIYRGVIDE